MQECREDLPGSGAAGSEDEDPARRSHSVFSLFLFCSGFSCSFSLFFSLFLWFWKLVLEQRRRSMGFLFHCPPLYVPFPCFAVLSLVSLFFFPLCFRLCSLFTSIVFSPSVFFRSQSLSISPASSPWLFRASRFYSCFSFPRFCPFFPSFSSSCSWLSLSFSAPQNLPVFVCVLASFFPLVLAFGSWLSFFFSLLCFFEKKQRNASLLFFFFFSSSCSPPRLRSLFSGFIAT